MPKCKSSYPPKRRFHPLTRRGPVFCDYCDVYLTHDSMSVRKAHNSGRNHLRNVVDYYQRKLSLFPIHFPASLLSPPISNSHVSSQKSATKKPNR
jgi:hypothetical protein